MAETDILNDITRDSDYPSNSNNERLNPGVPISEPTRKPATAAKTEPSRVSNPVAKGRLKKDSTAKKAVKSMIKVDGHQIKDFVFGEVLIPTLKDAVYKIITNGLSMVLFDRVDGPRESRSGLSGTRISYSGYYRGDNPPRESRSDRYSRRESFVPDGQIVYTTRQEAEDIIDGMADIIDQYGQVSIADMYDLSDVSAPPHTYNRYGWRTTRDFYTRHTADGWVIVTPRAIVL